jgi:hypothetical protein
VAETVVSVAVAAAVVLVAAAGIGSNRPFSAYIETIFKCYSQNENSSY